MALFFPVLVYILREMENSMVKEVMSMVKRVAFHILSYDNGLSQYDFLVKLKVKKKDDGEVSAWDLN